jgi:hypothetical protein
VTTFCEDCEHVHPESRKRDPRYWLCTQHPQIEGMGFVSKDAWTNSEPFLLCRNVNGGACKLYKARRDGQKEIGV